MPDVGIFPLLSQATTLDRSKEKLVPNARVLSPEKAKANIVALGKRLAVEAAQRRDPRASESEAVRGAAQFIRELMVDVEGIAAGGNIWEGLLARANVSAEEIASMRYISEVADLGQFRKQLEIPARHLGITTEELRRVRPGQFPTWLIHLAYTRAPPTREAYPGERFRRHASSLPCPLYGRVVCGQAHL